MQLKGLVRFFTILLIVYSLYQLSFTLFVRQHEKKMEARAHAFVDTYFPTPAAKYPSNKDSQAMYAEVRDTIYQARLKRLLDSTKDVIVTYGINGPMSYQKAKEEELNLGLDLQGGMNVTLEVEMTGLLNTLSNNSKDPVFLKAIANAEKRKANSSANFVTLFAEEYKQLSNDGQLAGLFAANSAGKITFRSTNSEVIKYLNAQTGEAFQSTYNILTKRIDQFGVAQPNINKEADRGIITVELPGVKDRERVKRLLQSSANLQFWDAYTFKDIKNSLDQVEGAFDNFLKGITPDTAKVDTTGKNGLAVDTSGNKVDTTKVVKFGTNDTARGVQKSTTPNTAQQPVNTTKRSLAEYLIGDPSGSTLGYVKKDTRQAFDPIKGPIVEMEMNAVGANKWGTITEKSAKEQTPIAIVLDGVVYSAPIAERRLGDRSQITGNFTVQEAQDLASILRIGKLKAPAKIVQDQQVGPTLGRDALNKGMIAFAIAFVVIFSLMLVYYNTAGWVANIALILNLLFTVGVLAGLGATLTAPGIAGLVLTIGMAVDTNVIIYERIKEELTRGK